MSDSGSIGIRGGGGGRASGACPILISTLLQHFQLTMGKKEDALSPLLPSLVIRDNDVQGKITWPGIQHKRLIYSVRF